MSRTGGPRVHEHSVDLFILDGRMCVLCCCPLFPFVLECVCHGLRGRPCGGKARTQVQAGRYKE